MKNIFKKLIENIKANPFEAQLLAVFVYPILPLALYLSWVITIGWGFTRSIFYLLFGSLASNYSFSI